MILTLAYIVRGCFFILNMMCELILSYFIVGAMEASPGIMSVDYIQRMPTVNAPAEVIVRTVHMPTNDYLNCWGNGYN